MASGGAARAERGNFGGLSFGEHRADHHEVVGDDTADLKQQYEKWNACEEELFIEGPEHLDQFGTGTGALLGRIQVAGKAGQRVSDRDGVTGVHGLQVYFVVAVVVGNDLREAGREEPEEGALRDVHEVCLPGTRGSIDRVRVARPVAVTGVERLDNADDYDGQRGSFVVPERVEIDGIAEREAVQLRRLKADRNRNRQIVVGRHGLGEDALDDPDVGLEVRAEEQVASRAGVVAEIGQRARVDRVERRAGTLANETGEGATESAGDGGIDDLFGALVVGAADGLSIAGDGDV